MRDIDAQAKSDAVLVKAIATERCRESFAELYSRYERSVYGVAYALTGNRTLAEETVQNSMLRVWLSAATFEPGVVQSWIHCIVAREGLKLMKERRDDHARKIDCAKELVQAAPAREDSDRFELLAALQEALFDLPELERKLITLYFVVGMTQKEIALELETPQQTISRHIQETVETLRSNLTKAGFAAALPLIVAEGLKESICLSSAAPSGLRQKVMHAIHAQPASVGSPITAKTALLYLAIGVAVLASFVVGIAWKPVLITSLRPAPLVRPSRATPSWTPVTDTFHEVFGKSGTWTVEQKSNGLAVSYTAPSGSGNGDPSYCYLGKNFSTSFELKGVVESTGTANPASPGSDTMLFLICHPNRINCTGYPCALPPASPIRFRMQVRFDERGCQFALATASASGERRQTRTVESWTAPPWNQADGSHWDLLSFTNMREGGFGFEALNSTRISDLQIRPLVESEWSKGIEDEK